MRGVRGTERNVILGFRVPTTSGRKKFDDHIYVVCHNSVSLISMKLWVPQQRHWLSSVGELASCR